MSGKKNIQAENTIPAGYTLDYVSGKQLKETNKELVRQRVVRALIHEYGFSPEDMELDLSIGGRKKVDVAIFHHGKEHTIENLGRAVICRQEPNVGRKTVRIRDYEQAATDLGELETIMLEVDAVQYGLWTNGLEFFFVEKEQKRFETKFNPIGDWPMAEESVGTKDVISDAHIRVADSEMLKITFRRCHNFIHGNEGMPKDAAFWQFLYLIFCKMHDESLRAKQRQAWQRRFWAGPKEQFEAQGRKAIRVRIEELFAEVKKKYKNIFRGNEEIALSDRALAFIVSELAKYDFTRTDVDAKGVAYQELVGVNLRGDRGQYFTPRGVVKLVVEMLDPKESETLLDPACGTGGFLVATLGHMLKKFRKEQKTQPGNENTSEFLNVHERLREYAAANVFGADFDPFLIRAAQMNMVLAGDGRGHIYNINSLEFPLGHLADLSSAKKEIPLGSVDIIATNPPFGSDIPITDEHILKQYELAHNWEPDGEGGFRSTGVLKGSVAPEILFIERCIKWLKPGKGRMGIVLPDGVLGNPAAEYIRWWIMREAQILASVDLPVEAFIAEANVNILTSLLFLRRKNDQEKHREALGGSEEYSVFMAVADKVGIDRRGNKLYKRTPDGEEIVEPKQHTERIRIGGRFVERTLTRSEKIEDNDLPVIAEKYREFLKEHDGCASKNEVTEVPQAVAEESNPDNFFFDLLTGEKESATPKKLLVQKVLRQLIESYGFDRVDLEVNYNPRIQGQGRKRIDIAVFRPGSEHKNDNLQRVIVCKVQKKRDKLRSITEADADLRELKELLELIPGATLGMWSNGQEEFLFQVERARFEVRQKPLGVWPVPGEHTTDLDRTGGVIQIGAEAETLEDALLRCHQYLNRNLGLDHKDSFKQLAVLMLAKIYDETLPTGDRKFWIKGDEPFTEDGQQAIARRINESITSAKTWQPQLLTRGWDLTLEADQTARVVMELARYSLSETQPRYRTGAFRSIASGVMDGREGRYPTPLNVAEMAVEMLDPQPGERILDCSSGTGTFLAMTAVHIFKKNLATIGTTVDEATSEQIRSAQNETAAWAASNALGCDIDPFLAVTSRMNLLFTTGNPGRIFRIDARTFPDGDLDGNDAARPAMQLGTMDMVLLNPWFSTQDTVSDASILQRYDLGNIWEPDEEGGFRTTGNLNTGGVPPEVLFIERALQWVKPGTGRVGILLPDGLLGNPAQEDVRWWILRHCEVLASVDLPVEPFKVTVKEYGLTPALPSFLVLRRRSQAELVNTEHPEYKVFMAVVDRAGVDARGKLLFQRAPDGEELIFDEQVIERIRRGGEIEIRRNARRNRRVHDELPIIAEKFQEFLLTGEVTA